MYLFIEQTTNLPCSNLITYATSIFLPIENYLAKQSDHLVGQIVGLHTLLVYRQLVYIPYW